MSSSVEEKLCELQSSFLCCSLCKCLKWLWKDCCGGRRVYPWCWSRTRRVRVMLGRDLPDCDIMISLKVLALKKKSQVYRNHACCIWPNARITFRPDNCWTKHPLIHTQTHTHSLTTEEPSKALDWLSMGRWKMRTRGKLRLKSWALLVDNSSCLEVYPVLRIVFILRRKENARTQSN